MKKIWLFGAVVLSLILAGNGWGAIIDVPGDMILQDALDTAADNGEDDTINIAANTYDASLSTFSYTPAAGENNSLTIAGAGAGSTILYGGGLTRVMDIYTEGLDNDSNAHVTVSGITFQNGVASQAGTGLFILTELANVIVEDCEFRGNTAKDWDGGGAYASSIGDPSGDVTLRNNTFRNSTSSAMVGIPRGGGAYGNSNSGALTFTNNIFNGNTAEYDGGGAYGTSQTGTVTFTNNTFSGNDALNEGGGFLITLTVNSTGNIYNNIAWNNTATGNGDDICVNHTGATVNLYNNDYTEFYMQVGCSLSQGNNMSSDPLFVDVSNPDPSNWDLHLTDTSPCIDAGTAAAPSLPATDCDGEQRTSGTAPDIGADEVPAPDIDVNPSSINFGSVIVGDVTTTNVTVANEGTLDLTVNTISDPGGPFTLSNVPGLPAVIAGGGSMVFGVTFAPTGTGDFNATVTVVSDDQDEPSIDVIVSGSGIALDPPSRRGGGGGGCFIATAAYGSALSSEVTIFKQLRDEFLLTNELRSAFVSAYNRYSPRLADRIAKHPMVRKMVRMGLYPILELSKWFVEENDSKQPSKKAE